MFGPIYGLHLCLPRRMVTENQHVFFFLLLKYISLSLFCAVVLFAYACYNMFLVVFICCILYLSLLFSFCARTFIYYFIISPCTHTGWENSWSKRSPSSLPPFVYFNICFLQLCTQRLIIKSCHIISKNYTQ